jgi:hypothetical protein
MGRKGCEDGLAGHAPHIEREHLEGAVLVAAARDGEAHPAALCEERAETRQSGWQE